MNNTPTTAEYLESLQNDLEKITSTLNLQEGTNFTDIAQMTESGEINKGVYKVASIEERDDIENPEDGDICLVYSNIQASISNPPLAVTYTFPDTATFASAISDEKGLNIYYERKVGKKYYITSVDITLNDTSCVILIENDDEEEEYTINYTSNDGITYTKIDGIDNYTLPDVEWDVEPFDIECTKFMLSGGISFNGIYVYENNDWEYLDIDIDTTASQILQGKKAYTSNGTITGTLSGGGVEPNIYVQTTEPTGKDGIWVESNLTYDDIVVDENVYLEKTWSTNKVTQLPETNNGGGIQVGNYYYAWFYDNTNGYKYDFTTKTWTSIASRPKSGFCNAISANENYIYFNLSSYSNYYYSCIYDIANDTYYESDTISSLFSGGCSAIKDKIVYRFCDNKAYKIDFTNSFTNPVVTDISLNNNRYFKGKSYLVGDDIYLFGFTNVYADIGPYIYKYNITNNTYTNLDTPNVPSQFYGSNLQTTGLVKVDDYIYFYPESSGNSDTQGIFRYSISNNTIEVFESASSMFSTNSKTHCGFAYYDDNLHIMGYGLLPSGSGTYTYYKTVRSLTIKNKDYPTNSVVIKQGTSASTSRMVNLYTDNNVTGKIKSPVDNVYLYNNNQLYTDLPTYRGNGTTWTQFKG